MLQLWMCVSDIVIQIPKRPLAYKITVCCSHASTAGMLKDAMCNTRQQTFGCHSICRTSIWCTTGICLSPSITVILLAYVMVVLG